MRKGKYECLKDVSLAHSYKNRLTSGRLYIDKHISPRQIDSFVLLIFLSKTTYKRGGGG